MFGGDANVWKKVLRQKHWHVTEEPSPRADQGLWIRGVNCRIWFYCLFMNFFLLCLVFTVATVKVPLHHDKFHSVHKSCAMKISGVAKNIFWDALYRSGKKKKLKIASLRPNNILFSCSYLILVFAFKFIDACKKHGRKKGRKKGIHHLENLLGCSDTKTRLATLVS